MKPIMLLQESLPFHGGVARGFQRLLPQLPRELVHVGVLINTPDSILPCLQNDGSHVVTFGSKSNPLLVVRLRRYLKRHGIAAVFACSFRSYLAAKAAAIGLDCRVVFWLSDFTLIPKPMRFQFFQLVSGSDWLIGTTAALLAAHSKPGRPRTAVLNNGVEEPKCIDRAEARKSLGISKNATLLLYAGDSKPYKNHETLLKAFGQLAEEWPHLQLLLCGNPGNLGDVIEDPRVLGQPLCRRVMHLGQREDMFRLYSAADIYVHPCYNEGFGNSVVEAMLAGLPVVAANGGGLPEVIANTGVQFESQNVRALKNAIELLLCEPEKRNDYAARGRARAHLHFNLENFGKRFMSVCNLVLEDTP